MTTHFHHRRDAQSAAPAVVSDQPASHSFDGTKGLSAMLLAAMVSALLVVADQLIDAWADGHLMVAWVALWLVGFTAIALFGDAAHKLAGVVASNVERGLKRKVKARADQSLLQSASSDSGVMVDLNAALARQEP